MHTSPSTGSFSSGIRSIVVGILALTVLAAVCVLPWKNEEPSTDKRLWSEKTELLVSAKERSGREACMNRLDERLKTAGSADWQTFLSDTGVARDGVFGYVDENGRSKMTRLSSEFLERSAVDSDELKEKLTQKHKFVDMGSTRILVYSDNTVVTADTKECQVSGVYLGSENELHPGVSKSLGRSLQMARDKKKLCRTKYGSCSRDGAVCSVKARESCGRLTCNTHLPCPGGWRKYGGYFSCEGDGCNAACNRVNCGSVGQYGKCTVDTSNCDFSHLDKKIADTSTTVGNVVSAIQTGLSLGSLIPPPGDTAFGFISAAVGFANNAAMTPEQAYNKMMQELQAAVTQMKTCVDEKIMQTNVFDVATSVKTIETRLDLAKVKLGTPRGRVDRIYRPNEGECTKIGARFTVIANAQTSQVKVDTLFPHALQALEVCSLNFLGTVVDEKKGHFPAADFALVQAIYKRMASDVESSVTKMINWLNAYHSSSKQCGFFNSHKRKLSSYISNLRTEYLEPMKKLRASIANGKRVTLSAAHSRKNSVVQSTNERVRAGDEVGESMTTADGLSCLQACLNGGRGLCVAADAIPQVEKDGSVSTLCRLYSQQVRDDLKLVLESHRGALHFDLARA